MLPGKFITLEGGEGGGKSTQAKRLVAYLNEHGIPTIHMRDPGGTPTSMLIREIFVKGSDESLLPETELLLIFASRTDLWQRGIKPQLQTGSWVVSDRWFDTSYAYQGKARALGYEAVHTVQKIALGDEGEPDLTFLLDMPAADGLQRGKGHTTGETRFEDIGLKFHEDVRLGFHERLQAMQHRMVKLDATKSIDEVFDAITHEISRRFLNKAA